MKTAKVLFAIVLISALMFSCNSQKLDEKSNVNLQREWMMISFKDYSKQDLNRHEAKINLIPNAEQSNQYSAKMGCNNLFFTAKLKSGNKIEFSNVGGTLMFCQDKMDLERNFGKALPTMTDYKIEGHFLTLSSKNGDNIKFVAADWD